MSATTQFHPILPRFIRLRDAPFYLGIDKNRFNQEVRPSLTEIKIGQQGIAFCRIELDAWADNYIRQFGKPGQNKQNKQEKSSWLKNQQASQNATESTSSTRSSKADAFTKALAQVTSKKRNAT